MEDKKPVGEQVEQTEQTAEEYFVRERDAFVRRADQSAQLSHLIGAREADARGIWASWLFMRVCVTAKSIERLLTPLRSGYGDISYLDHGSIAPLARGAIENIAVLLYLGDRDISDVQWECRKRLIDLHDYRTRREFLALLGSAEDPKKSKEIMHELQDRLRNNAYFLSLPKKRQKRLLNAEDMYIDGRMNALGKIGWSTDQTKAIYKYLSMQAHTMPMSFHRTEINQVYTKDSNAVKAIAGFAIEHARQALGVGCLRAVKLFPDIEGKLDPVALNEWKQEQ